MKISILLLSFALSSLLSVQLQAQTCYENYYVTCEELTGLSGQACDYTDCQPMYMPITNLLLGYFCDPSAKNRDVSQDVDVAAHVSYGLGSTSTGATVKCVKEQDCKAGCGFPGEGETLHCQGDGDWAESQPFTHTYASGTACG